MPLRYFESKTPTSRIMAAGGQVIRWETYDGQVGWFVTDRPGSIKTLLDCIDRKVGGAIREGTQNEYEAFLGKSKGRPVFRQARESIGTDGSVRSTLVPPVPPSPAASPEAAAAADVTPPPPSDPTSPPEPVLRNRHRPRGTDAKP